MEDGMESLNNLTRIINMGNVNPAINLSSGTFTKPEEPQKSEFDLLVEQITENKQPLPLPPTPSTEREEYEESNILEEIPDKKTDELYDIKVKQNSHEHMKKAMDAFGVEKVDYEFDKERKEDLRSAMLEEIDCLREELENCAVKLDGITIPNNNSSDAEIENCLRILRKKSDRNKYCTYAEEGILMFAHGIEELFDGHNSFFGYRPNMRGWSSNVENKLRRMKYDTSKLVSQVMHDYNIGPGTRLLLELVPNAILYSIRKSKMAVAEDKVEVLTADTLNKMRDIKFE